MKSPGTIWRETIGNPSRIAVYEAELAANDARDGKMPEPTAEEIAQAKAEAVAEAARLAGVISKEADPAKKEAAEDAKASADAAVASAEYWERVKAGATTKEDDARMAREQAAYEAEMAAKLEWVEKQ